MDIRQNAVYIRAMTVSTLIPESVSRTERKRARNRDALVAAARRLFSEQGFEATTIAAIAEAADLGFGTFYRYFPDKEAVLQAVLDLGKAEIDAVLTHPENTTAPAREALCGLTKRFVKAARRTHDVGALFWKVGILGAGRPGANRVLADALKPERLLPAILANAIASIIERGIEEGVFRRVDPVLTARFLASAHMYLLGPTGLDYSEKHVIDTLCELELRALATDTPDRPRNALRRPR
jgi:AcrR family transcriptional regulator